MAVTKIWPVRDRFDKVLDYAANAKKTDADLEKLHALDNVIDYAADGDKTEKCFYVSGVNCMPENAKEAFAATQKRWGKTTGKVAFHMYQSFAEGEVDAKTAHEIGVRLAEEVFGERFEALVGTHLNTRHFHNHIIINAVSWKDGLRYNDCPATYRKIREVSDRLCREYGLSVFEHPQGKAKPYAEYKAEQDGQWTVRGAIRAAIDTAVRGSQTKAQFIDAMEQMGFVIDQSGKYPKIKQVGAERFVRFKSLGDGYDVPDILARIAENERQMFPRIPEQEDPLQVFDGEEEPVALMTFVPLYRSYNRALTLATERPKTNRRIYFLIRQDTSTMRLYVDSARLVSEHQLHSKEDVLVYRQHAMDEIGRFTKERQDARNAIKRAQRSGDTNLYSHAKYNVQVLTRRLAKLRREVTTCGEVIERSEHVRENLRRIAENDFRGDIIRGNFCNTVAEVERN